MNNEIEESSEENNIIESDEDNIEKLNLIQTTKTEKETLPTTKNNNNSVKKNKKNMKKIFNAKSKKKEIGKGKILKKNLNEEFRLSSSTPKAPNTQKSVFTRLSEQMFEKLLKNKGMENVYNYESFTNDNFLTNYSNKFDSKNKKLRNDFLSRNFKEVEKRKNNKNKNNEYIIQNKKREVMNKTQLNNFLDKQKTYINKRKQDIESLKQKIEGKRTLTIRDIPLTNSNSNKIILLKSSNYNVNKDTFSRLYDGYNKNEQKSIISNKPRSPLNNKEEAKKIFNKLYNDSKKYKDNIEEKRKIYNKNDYKLTVNSSSNDIISQQLLKKYESVINNFFNKKADDNFKINFTDYLLLLNKIGFTIKDYSNLGNYNNNIEKELQLSKVGFKILTESKQFEQDKNIDSHKFILFLLSILRLYNGDNENQFMKKNFQFIKNEINIPPKITEKIKIDFRLFSDNFMNSLIKREKISRSTMSFIENKEKDLTFKPKLNYSFYENNTDKHSSIIQNYDLFRQKREKFLELERKKNEEEEMKECTFFPNNNPGKTLQKTKSVTGGFSERLYMKRKKNNEMTKSMKENEDENNIFSPNLTAYNNKMFKYNPLLNDKSLSKKYEDLENERKQKKISKYLVSKGICNSINNRNNEEILREIEINEDCLRNFKFDNEIGSYKNTFNKFEKKNPDNLKRKVRYIFEINIDNKKKKLILHKRDNMEREVEKFCYENDLEPESKYKIISAIKSKFNFE